jgi:hypothetical protein
MMESARKKIVAVIDQFSCENQPLNIQVKENIFELVQLWFSGILPGTYV